LVPVCSRTPQNRYRQDSTLQATLLTITSDRRISPAVG
jgi:hypothetical protein